VAKRNKRVHRIDVLFYMFIFIILGISSLVGVYAGITSTRNSYKVMLEENKEFKYLDIMRAQERLDMCNFKEDIKLGSIVNGFYMPSSYYYVVWIKNRSFSDIERTDRHEYCHYLVDEDYDHFCS